MEEKKISEKESLLLIRQMIQTAKKEQKDDGMGWIVWGYLLLLASVLTICNLNFRWFDDLFLFWNAFGAVTFVLLIWETVMPEIAFNVIPPEAVVAEAAAAILVWPVEK